MKLVYTKNFWDFYIQNKSNVDKIVYAQFKALHVPSNRARELFHDVLIRMHDKKVLERFDSSMAKLNTFLTWTIRGYIQQIITKENREFPFQCKNEEGYYVTLPGEQTYLPDLNTLPDSWDRQNRREVSSGDFMDMVITNDLISKIKSILTKKEQRILDLVLYGLNDTQIGSCLGVTGRLITAIKSKKIREKVQKLLSKEVCFA